MSESDNTAPGSTSSQRRRLKCDHSLAGHTLHKPINQPLGTEDQFVTGLASRRPVDVTVCVTRDSRHLT